MEMNDYQDKARTTATYPSLNIETNDGTISFNYTYPALGLAGEAGEVAEKIKKLIRDNNGKIETDKREEIKKELGDVLWYLSNLAKEFDYTLNEIAEANLKKLFSRKKRNKIKGSGDNR